MADELRPEDKKRLLEAGVDLDAGYATFMMLNQEVKVLGGGDFVLTSLHRARKEYPWLKDLEWTLVPPDKDQFTREAYEADADGYFLYVPKGVKVPTPVQACFFIKLGGYRQRTHNVIVVEEGAEAHITNGCAVAAYLDNGAHLGITEIFVGKDALLTYTMIHAWAPEVEVRPRTGVRVDAGGKYVSTYVSLKEAQLVQSAPRVELVGEGAVAELNSVIYAPEGSKYDVGGVVLLKAPETRAEILSRSVSAGGVIRSPVAIEAHAPGTRGHITCDGLMLTEKGGIITVPGLTAYVQDTQLSHEAAVGRISDEELFYLMARGLSEEEATSLIVKGFVSLRVPGLPKVVQASIDQTVAMLAAGGL